LHAEHNCQWYGEKPGKQFVNEIANNEENLQKNEIIKNE
jgi:hypothetical protein